MTYVKYTFCGLTLAASVTLLAMSCLRKSSQISNKLNKPIIIMCAIHILFAFAPGVILPFLINLMSADINFTEILGDTSLTCICISNALSVKIYFKAYKKNFFKPTISAETMF
uniref:PIN-like protein n=1 Tax=Panagrolaimus davidi TaxID=227884 RepID=A0A914Q2N6_9BILA